MSMSSLLDLLLTITGLHVLFDMLTVGMVVLAALTVLVVLARALSITAVPPLAKNHRSGARR